MQNLFRDVRQVESFVQSRVGQNRHLEPSRNYSVHVERPRNVFAHVQRVRVIVDAVTLRHRHDDFGKSGTVGGDDLIDDVATDFNANFFGHVIERRRAQRSLAAENPRQERERQYRQNKRRARKFLQPKAQRREEYHEYEEKESELHVGTHGVIGVDARRNQNYVRRPQRQTQPKFCQHEQKFVRFAPHKNCRQCREDQQCRAVIVEEQRLNHNFCRVDDLREKIFLEGYRLRTTAVRLEEQTYQPKNQRDEQRPILREKFSRLEIFRDDAAQQLDADEDCQYARRPHVGENCQIQREEQSETLPRRAVENFFCHVDASEQHHERGVEQIRQNVVEETIGVGRVEEIEIVLSVVFEENCEVQKQEHHAEKICRQLVEAKNFFGEEHEHHHVSRDENAARQCNGERECRQIIADNRCDDESGEITANREKSFGQDFDGIPTAPFRQARSRVADNVPVVAVKKNDRVHLRKKNEHRRENQRARQKFNVKIFHRLSSFAH